MPRILAALTLAVALAAAGGAAAAQPARELPLYLNQTGDALQLVSNAKWSGAKEVSQPSPRTDSEAQAFVWAPTCLAGAQTARFRRVVELPGPLLKGTVSVNLNGTFASREIRVNGRTLERATLSPSSGNSIPIDQTLGKLFKPGQNLIEVLVAKRSAAAGGACSTSPTNRTGVLFSFSGEFYTDLSLVEPAGVREYRKVSAIGSFSLIAIITVKNKGPGIAHHAVFTLDPTAQVVLLQTGGNPNPKDGIGGGLPPPFKSCEIVPNGGTSKRVVCELENFAPGMTGALQLGLSVPVNLKSVDFTEVSASFGWRISGLGLDDLKLDNNDRRAQFTWCGTLATSEGCKSAK